MGRPKRAVLITSKPKPVSADPDTVRESFKGGRQKNVCALFFSKQTVLEEGEKKKKKGGGHCLCARKPVFVEGSDANNFEIGCTDN